MKMVRCKINARLYQFAIAPQEFFANFGLFGYNTAMTRASIIAVMASTTSVAAISVARGVFMSATQGAQ